MANVTLEKDPSRSLQHFYRYEYELLCCRYWTMEYWEHAELSFPYWRIYHNDDPGAFITCNGKQISISPRKMYIIPSYTSFSSHLFDYPVNPEANNCKGSKVTTDTNRDAKHTVRHLFIHFDINATLARFPETVYETECTSEMQMATEEIEKALIKDSENISSHTTFLINMLVNKMLSVIPNNYWTSIVKDSRIMNTIYFIGQNIQNKIDNTLLAKRVFLATNSFARLFKENTGLSPQNYILKKRIELACKLLHHTSKSIEAIATETGFSNRYHFTRQFSSATHISPAKYRKEL